VEPLLTLATVVVASSIGLLLARKRRQRRLDAWRLAAKRVGLTDVQLEEGGLWGEGALLGRSGDLHVRLEVYAAGKSESGTKIVVSGLGDGAGGLSLRREGLSTALERRVVGDREIRVGDPSFDEEYYVQGEPALVLALLDADTRATLAALMQNRVATPRGESVKAGTSLNDGVLEVRVQDGAFSTNLQRLPDVLAAVIEVARRLVAPVDLAARIASNLRAEPEAGVRLQCLTTLAREFPDDPATREALLRAREDPHAEVRLRAGIALGSEGRDVLRAVAAGEGAADETTERAVAALEPELTVEEAMGLLRAALRTRRIATAKACLVAVGRRGGTEAIALLARVLAVETGELAWAAARALAITRDPAAEEPLLRALAEGSRDLRLAAAAALRHVGTATAVAPLREAEQHDAEMRRTVRQAIAEIQSRLSGAEPGQLSLAGGEAGRLSLAEGEEGRLSLAREGRDDGGPSG
jgi:hypothetical protein